MKLEPSLSRRGFLAGSGAFVLSISLAGCAPARLGAPTLDTPNASPPSGDPATESFSANAFVIIGADDSVTVVSKHLEFGQGPWSGLATLVAEEMDADWSQMRAVSSPTDPIYNNLNLGMQSTGGSTSMANSYLQLRKAGAAARQMLVEAAAETWSVETREIGVEAGVIRHDASNRSSHFGAFAELASKRAVPTDPVLKNPAEFVLIGKESSRLDSAIKSTGQAEFTIDQFREGMLTTVIEHPPKFGATVAKVDDTEALAVPGVREVHTIPSGVAVYAEDTYAALQGRKALQVEWDESAAETRSTEEIVAQYRAQASQIGAVVASHGDVEQALTSTNATRLEREIVFPYLAHAPMEPLDAIIERKGDGIKASFGSQGPGSDRNAIAEVLGIAADAVEVESLLCGGSFGRRAQPSSSFAREVAEVYKAQAKSRPIKLMWTREDDIRGGYYRPLMVHRLSGAITQEGDISAWEQRIVGQSIMQGTPFEGMIKNGIDQSVVEGASDQPYTIPNFRVSLHLMSTGVPVLWWRSVGHTHTGFAVETFIDELLEAGGRDAVAGRLALLSDHPREARVLERAAEMADWGRSLPDGRALGVAVHKSFNTFVAQIVEVSVTSNPERPRVHRVFCAVDCGLAVNPDIVRAQVEGGIGFGLGAALYGEITLAPGGRVRQSNFDTYRSLRIHEMPEIDVAIIESSDAPTGIGEPGVPPIAPAVANAWRKLTGKTTNRLPFSPLA